MFDEIKTPTIGKIPEKAENQRAYLSRDLLTAQELIRREGQKQDYAFLSEIKDRFLLD
jgi:hypothetical protein